MRRKGEHTLEILPFCFPLQWEGCQALPPPSIPFRSSETWLWMRCPRAPSEAEPRRASGAEAPPQGPEPQCSRALLRHDTRWCSFQGFGHHFFPLYWAWGQGQPAAWEQPPSSTCPSGQTELSLCVFLWEKHLLFLYTFLNPNSAVTVHFLLHCFLFSVKCYLNL